jgi:hypothetical protein
MGLAPQLPPLAGVRPVPNVPATRLVEIMIVSFAMRSLWYVRAVRSPGYEGFPASVSFSVQQLRASQAR